MSLCFWLAALYAVLGARNNFRDNATMLWDLKIFACRVVVKVLIFVNLSQGNIFASSRQIKWGINIVNSFNLPWSLLTHSAHPFDHAPPTNHSPISAITPPPPTTTTIESLQSPGSLNPDSGSFIQTSKQDSEDSLLYSSVGQSKQKYFRMQFITLPLQFLFFYNKTSTIFLYTTYCCWT